jgi:hypothetical protein
MAVSKIIKSKRPRGRPLKHINDKVGFLSEKDAVQYLDDYKKMQDCSFMLLYATVLYGKAKLSMEIGDFMELCRLKELKIPSLIETSSGEIVDTDKVNKHDHW